MQDLKANTQTIVTIGPFVDKTDGLTPETGVTLSGADEAELLKHGSTTVVSIAAATWAAVTGADGYYSLTLTTSHTDTEGQLTVIVNDDSVCLPVIARFKVLSEAAYDSLYVAKDTGFMDVNVKAVSDDTTAADNLELDYDGTGYNKSASTVGTVTTVTGIAGTITSLDALDTAQDTQHSTTQSNIAALNDISAADVNAQCDTALSDIGLDHLVSASVTGTDITDNSIIAKLVSSEATADWDDYVNTDDSLQAIRDRGDAAWTTGAGGTPPQLLQSTTIATLASQTSFTLTAGSADDDAYNGAVVVVTDQSTSTQKAVGSVSDYTGSTKTVTLSADPGIFTMATGDSIDVIANASTAPSAAAVRAEIDSNSTQLAAIVADTNELQGDWANGGRLDLILDATASQTSVDTIDGIVDAILVDTGTTLPASIATIDTNVDAILVDTGTTLPASLTTIEGKVDTVDTNVDAILVDTGTTLPASLATIDTNVDSILVDTGTTLPASIAALQTDLDTITDTGVTCVALTTAAITDVWSTDTLTEAYAADGAAGTPAQILYMIQQATTEASITGTTLTVKKLDGSTTAATFTLDDATTPTSRTRAT